MNTSIFKAILLAVMVIGLAGCSKPAADTESLERANQRIRDLEAEVTRLKASPPRVQPVVTAPKLTGTFQARGPVPDLGNNPTLQFLPNGKVKMLLGGGINVLADSAVDGNQVTLTIPQGLFYEFTIYPNRLVIRSGQVFEKQ